MCMCSCTGCCVTTESVTKFESDMNTGIDKHLTTALQGITDTLLPKHWSELAMQTGDTQYYSISYKTLMCSDSSSKLTYSVMC
jgi:hypothetical protein